MTAKEKLEKIRKMVFGDSKPKLFDFTLADGATIIQMSVDKPANEALVSIGGNAAPDGEYTLQDGTKITVAKGAISAVFEKEIPKPEAIDPTLQSKVSEMEEKMVGQEKDLIALKTELGTIKKEFADQKTAFEKQSEAVKELIPIVEEIAKETPPPAERVKSPFEAHKTDPQERLQALQKTIKEMRKVA